MIINAYSGGIEDALASVENAINNAKSTQVALTGDLEEIVEWILVETEYGPPIYVERPFIDKGESETGTAAAMLKPRFTVKLKGFDPQAYAPYGNPGPTKWPLISTTLTLGGILLGVLYFKGAFKKGK